MGDLILGHSRPVVGGETVGQSQLGLIAEVSDEVTRLAVVKETEAVLRVGQPRAALFGVNILGIVAYPSVVFALRHDRESTLVVDLGEPVAVREGVLAYVRYTAREGEGGERFVVRESIFAYRRDSTAESDALELGPVESVRRDVGQPLGEHKVFCAAPVRIRKPAAVRVELPFHDDGTVADQGHGVERVATGEYPKRRHDGANRYSRGDELFVVAEHRVIERHGDRDDELAERTVFKSEAPYAYKIGILGDGERGERRAVRERAFSHGPDGRGESE